MSIVDSLGNFSSEYWVWTPLLRVRKSKSLGLDHLRLNDIRLLDSQRKLVVESGAEGFRILPEGGDYGVLGLIDDDEAR